MIDRHLKLFECLNRNKVEYLLIGGMLSIVYGVPRMTKDIDLFVKAEPQNAERLLSALKELGMGSAYLTDAKSICATEITIFKDFFRLDVLTSVKGLTFDDSWQHRAYLTLDQIPIHCVTLDDLIKSKKATGRPRDLDDLKILEMAREQRNK